MTIRVVIADDQPLVVEGLRAATANSEIEIVGCVNSCDVLVGAIETLRPDVLVAEFRLESADVIRALESYAEADGGCQIVFFSANENPTHLARASTIGGHDFVSKRAATVELLESIRSAAAGEPTPKSSRLKTIQSRILKGTDWEDTEIELTPRERQVLQHLAMGMSNREIGRSMSIRSTTVKEHVQKVMRKLDANDRTQAAVWAVREGII